MISSPALGVPCRPSTCTGIYGAALSTDILELKANPKRPASGTVLEAKLDRGRGPVATVLVQDGTLSVGDNFIAGPVVGRGRR